MKHTMSALLILGVCTVSLQAGFLEDYQAAAKLKPAQAAPKFAELAKKAPPAQKNNVLYQAGRRYVMIKKYAEAEKIAAQITDKKAVLLKMQAARAQNQWRVIWTLSEKEDISAWPEADQLAAYKIRGFAALRLAKYAKSIADHKAAAELAPDNSLEKAGIYNTLATIYKITKKNSEAIAYYKKILDMKSLSNYGLYKSAKSEYNRLSKSK